MKKVHFCAPILIVVLLVLFFNSPAQIKPALTPSFLSILHQAETIVEVQKILCDLLGLTVPPIEQNESDE